MSRTPRATAPSPTDRGGWRDAVQQNRLSAFRLEDIVAALQEMLRDNNTFVLNALIGFVSDTLIRMLTSRVSKKHRNEGRDIIDDAHDVLIRAVLQPQSADGIALRTTFAACVASRLIDAIRRELRDAQRHPSYDLDAAGEPVEPEDKTSWLAIEEGAVVEEVLATILDPRKRLAFRFFMQGVPFDSKKGASISKALGVSEKTARKWINEVRTQLKQLMEARHD